MDLYHLLVDFKVQQLKVPKKLINLIKMYLRGTKAKVKVQGMVSEEIWIKEGLRQGHALSAALFNMGLKRVLRNIPISKGGTIMNR